VRVITEIETMETKGNHSVNYIAKTDMPGLRMDEDVTADLTIKYEMIHGLHFASANGKSAYFGFSRNAIEALSPLFELMTPGFPRMKLNMDAGERLLLENRALHQELRELRASEKTQIKRLKKEEVTLLKDLAKISASRGKTAHQVCILAMEALYRAEVRAQEI